MGLPVTEILRHCASDAAAPAAPPLQVKHHSADSAPLQLVALDVRSERHTVALIRHRGAQPDTTPPLDPPGPMGRPQCGDPPEDLRQMHRRPGPRLAHDAQRAHVVRPGPEADTID